MPSIAPSTTSSFSFPIIRLLPLSMLLFLSTSSYLAVCHSRRSQLLLFWCMDVQVPGGGSINPRGGLGLILGGLIGTAGSVRGCILTGTKKFTVGSGDGRKREHIA